MAMAMTACAGAVAESPLARQESDDLLQRADRHQAAGDSAEALELYLRCFERCTEPYGTLAAARVRVGGSREGAEAISTTVARVEARVFDKQARGSGDPDDLERLAAFYSARKDSVGAKALLTKARTGGWVRTVSLLIDTYLDLLPGALDALEDVDVEILVADVEASPGRDRVVIGLLGEVRPKFAEDLAAARVERVHRHWKLLVKVGRKADAVRLVQAAANVGECDRMRAALQNDRELLSVVETHCRPPGQCSEGAPSSQ